MIVTSPGTLFVNELIAAGRYKYCFRHTPVNNPLPVQELEGAHNLRRVEPGSLCFKPEQEKYKQSLLSRPVDHHGFLTSST